MIMKKLAIVSGSSRVRESPKEPVRALERFGGPMIGVVRGYADKNRLENIDVLILSPTYGLISANQKIPYRRPIRASAGWHRFDPNEPNLANLKTPNLAKLKDLFAEKQYGEIYINVGKEFLPLIKGFETVVPKTTKITCARGAGFGYKLADMRRWLEINSRAAQQH